MTTDRRVSWVSHVADSERKALDPPMSCFNANDVGNSNENNAKKKSGGNYRWLFCIQRNDFQSKGIE